MRSTLLILFVFFSCLSSWSQEIVFSDSELSLRQVLDELNSVEQVNISYNSSSEHMSLGIQMEKRKWLVPEALAKIETLAPLSFIHENGHIVAVFRDLPENFILEGRVSFEGKGIDGATLVVTESQGMISDEEGYFRFVLKPGIYKLTTSFMGFRTYTRHISLFQNQNLEIELEEESFLIEEASVIGYRSDLDDLETGRVIVRLDRKKMGSHTLNNASDVLQARISGVWSSKVSGAPGDHQRIRIRGISSILGSSDPLYIVDGLPVPVLNLKSMGIGDLNVNDIQEISVLKDASSTAFYGYLGANGVVLIETGGGESRGEGFSFSYSAGLQQLNNFYPLMNSKDFLSNLKEYDQVFGTHFYFTNPVDGVYPKYPEYLDSLEYTTESTQWQKELFRFGSSQEYQLSYQKEMKQMDLYLSGNVFRHDGIVQNSSFEKYSMLAKLSKDIGPKLRLGLSYRGSIQSNQNNLDNYLGNDVILKGINYEPSYYSTPDTTLEKPERLFFNGSSSSVSLLADHSYTPEQLFYGMEKNRMENSHNLQLSGTYRLPFNLQIQARLGASFRNMDYISSLPHPKYMRSSEGVRILGQEYILSYANTWGAHHISSSFRFRNYNDNAFWEVDSTFNVDIVGLAPEDNIYIRGSQAIYGQSGSVIRSTSALIGQLNYRFRNSLNVSLLANYDHLKEGYYLDMKQLFPSVSFSWDIAKEAFSEIIPGLDKAELNYSWGISGNYPLNSLSNDIYYKMELGSGTSPTSRAVFISNLGNYGLKHERISEHNLGFHLSVFERRLDIRADRYFRKHNDLLLQRVIPYYYGGGDLLMNVGEMASSGYEIGLEAYPVLHQDFQWLIRAGYSKSNQILTSLAGSDTLMFYHDDILIPSFAAIAGERPGELFGYRYLGTVDEVFPIGSAPDSEGYAGEGRFVRNQVVYAKPDTVNTDELGKGDYTKIGNSLPDFTMHLTNAFQYRNWKIEMLWYAVVGVDKFNATKAASYITGTNNDVKALLLDSVSCHLTEELYRSSFFVEDASFIRLKTLSISYRFPRKILNKIGISTSLNLENLFTITPYSGYDPEASIYTDNNFSDNAIDRGSYPSPRGIYFTIKLNY